uniref:Uncharacterized protein n=1 Tax=Ananas comosus var. bracteatus TaxID=296719 RepID=A0A6V7NXS0_ANACO|nr:unnamed protein product [Ananas comosus var. bracteatus]
MEVRGRQEKKRGLAAVAGGVRGAEAVGSANPLLLHHPCSVTRLGRPEFSYRVGSPDRNAAADELLNILLFEGEEQEQDNDNNNNNNNEIESAGVFSGSSSPPSRPANPMVRDPMFGEVNPSEPFLLWAGGSTMGCTSSSSGRKACGPKKSEIRQPPPASRIEGFDLFDRERGRRRGITAIA